MNEFHDPEIERMLGASGGPFPDVNIAFQRVQGRVRQARRRRAVVLTSTTCALLLAAGAFAVGRNQGTADVGPANSAGRDSELRPDDSFDDETTSVSTEAPTTVTVATTATTVASTTVAAPVVTDPAAGPVIAPGSTTAPRTTTPATTPHNTTPHTVAPTTPPTSPPATDPPATTAPTNTLTLSGEGGSITVKLSNGNLTLISSHPASGFTTEVIQSSGNRVEVRFNSSHHRTKLRVDLKNGAMYPRDPQEESF